MPGRPLPRLRRKSNGAYFVRIFRRDYSLGSDPVEAETRRAALIAEHYRSPIDQAFPSSGDDAADGRPAGVTSPTRGALVAELLEPFLASLAAELDAPASRSVPGLPASVNRPAAIATYYRKHLARFVALHGRLGVARLAMPTPTRGVYQAPVVPLLFALRDDMTRNGYAARTVRHDLKAVERLFNWASARGYCPSVVFTQATKVRTPPPVPRPAPLEWIRADCARALAAGRSPLERIVGHAAALSYLACLRPSELVRLGHLLQAGAPPLGSIGLRPGAGPGVVQVHGKTTHLEGDHRVVPLSDEALERVGLLRHETLLWRQTRPRPRRSRGSDGARTPERLFPWSDPGAWSRAYREWTRGRAPEGWDSASVSPSTLRDSAATHLDEAGAAHADRELLLGHSVRGSLRSYDRPAWQRLRGTAALLTLR